MKENIRIRNRSGVCSIDIEGTIGVPEAWQFDDPAERVATYDAFREAVQRIGRVEADEVVVNIRSTGGDVNDALLIYDALRALDARIVTRCYGYTASAATIIAQAASEGAREVSANALYLVHKASCAAEGNAEELAARIDLLRRTDERLVALYAARSGRTAEEFERLMAENNGAGRWLSPEEAVAAGLADAVTGAASAGAAVRNIVRGWRRFAARIGARGARQPENDRSILHFDEPQRSGIGLRDGQEQAAPTATKPCEDPSVHDVLHTQNERAYADDARRFARF